MAREVLSVRVEDVTKQWLAEYASERGVSVAELLEQAVEAFRDDAARGVPEIRAMAERQAVSRDQDGVGVCPKRDDGGRGHVWAGWKEDPSNPCKFCGYSGRRFFREHTAERAELFSKLEAPKSVKSWGKQS